MERKRVILLTAVLIINVILIIGIPLTVISIQLKKSGRIDASRTFFYSPNTIHSVENVSINSKIGDITIEYIHPPQDYITKVEVRIEMSGFQLPSQTLEEIFKIDWDNQTCSNLTLE